MGSIGIVTGRDNVNFLDKKDIENFTNAQAFFGHARDESGKLNKEAGKRTDTRPDYIAVYDLDGKRAFNLEFNKNITADDYEKLMRGWNSRQNTTENAAQKVYENTFETNVNQGKSIAMAAALARKARNVSSAASFITLARQTLGDDAITLRARGATKSQIEAKIKQQAADRAKKKAARDRKKAAKLIK